jgi:putative DNA methylase
MLWADIAPADLALCSIGQGLAVYSRYSEVLEPDGRPLTIYTALDIINRAFDVFVIAEQEYLDVASRFAVAWFSRFSYTVRTIPEARQLARIRGVSIEHLITAAVLGSQGTRIWLRRWPDLDPRWDPRVDSRPPVWKATHHLIRRLNADGEDAAARLLARMPEETGAEARQLAYLLYHICERNGWLKDAQDYGTLIDAWGAIQPSEDVLAEPYHQPPLFDLE